MNIINIFWYFSLFFTSGPSILFFTHMFTTLLYILFYFLFHIFHLQTDIEQLLILKMLTNQSKLLDDKFLRFFNLYKYN